jgi:hypothetical protein
MMQPLSFATGGVDHAIHIWNVDRNLQATCSASPLAIKHTSKILSLLPIRDSSHKLVSSGADCKVNVYDLSSERVVNMIMLSNPGFHIHRLENPSTILFQVRPLQRFYGFNVWLRINRLLTGNTSSNYAIYVRDPQMKPSGLGLGLITFGYRDSLEVSSCSTVARSMPRVRQVMLHIQHYSLVVIW